MALTRPPEAQLSGRVGKIRLVHVVGGGSLGSPLGLAVDQVDPVTNDAQECFRAAVLPRGAELVAVVIATTQVIQEGACLAPAPGGEGAVGEVPEFRGGEVGG